MEALVTAISVGPRERSRVLDAAVGKAIRLHRRSAKMTLQELARVLGVAYQQVQKYEMGVNRVGAGRLMEIAAILNVPVAVFFENGGSYSPVTSNAALPTDAPVVAQERELLMLFFRLKDHKTRDCAVRYVQSLAESST